MKRIILTILAFCAVTFVSAQRRPNLLRETNPSFFKTAEARRIGDQVVLYQRVTGGWQKNVDMARRLTDEERAQVLAEKNRRDDSTTDNNATTMQMIYLARLYQATKDKTYREAFDKAVDYLLSGQWRMAAVLARDAWLPNPYHIQR